MILIAEILLSAGQDWEAEKLLIKSEMILQPDNNYSNKIVIT